MRFTTFFDQVQIKFAFFNFSKRYFGTHDTKLPANWAPDQNILNDFHAFLLKDVVLFGAAVALAAEALRAAAAERR